MRGRLSLIVVVALGLLGGVGWFVKGRSGESGEALIRTATVDRGDVMWSVTANGLLEPLTTVEVKSRAGGRIVEMRVEVGDEVTEGQLLARIDPSDSLATMRMAEADLAAAVARREQAAENLSAEQKSVQIDIAQALEALTVNQSRLAQAVHEAESQPQRTAASLRQAESARDTAKVNYDLALANLQRQHELFAKGFVPESAVEAAQAEVDRARASFAQALANLESVKVNAVQDDLRKLDLEAAKASVRQAELSLQGARDRAATVRIREADLRAADAQIERARAQLSNAQEQLADTTIVAPRGGVVLQRTVEEGTFISSGMSAQAQGTTLFVLGDVSEMFAAVEVDETDIGVIETGQPVEITVDAFPLQIFDGTVVKIEPQAVRAQNVTTVRVTVAMDMPPPFLKPNMNVSCAFIVEKVSDVVRVPVQSVLRREGQTRVRVQQGEGREGIVEQPVEVGVEGNDYVEVVSGLAEGTVIVTAIVETAPGGSAPATNPRGLTGAMPGGGRRR